uniref:Alpha-int-3 n=1 Tax=Schmidtea mediterranea TaxID=79327 RepID=A0A1P8CUU3_SCHMD|nr:alpha-int-3 [Schmidtea mediterranea]
MAVGKIFRNPNVKSIVLGSPGISQYDSTRTQIKFGQVVIGKLIENSLEYVGVIFGEVFGSGYGYSVLAMDLNNDGMDELVVGAPFTNNNNGQVFVYWNIEMSQSNIEHKTIPLDVEKRLLLTSMKKLSNGQYGISLENIGDINKDFIQDLAVGAPFENDGTGAVYIYLGDRHQIIKLSQKIEGQMISPDLRGYGFSIFGKNEDLDSNTYPDFIVGSVLSGHVVGMRTRPIIRVYAENMVAETDMQLPYSFDSLKKCNSNGQEMPCIKLSVSIYYYYPDLTTCPSYASSKTIDYEIELDMPFIKPFAGRCLYFENKLNTVTGGGSINCKTPNSKSNSIINTFNILFPVNLFFNISLPIEITMKWSLNVSEVPKRNFLSDDLADLSNYPVLERVKNNLTNTIHFGVGCSPGSCQPILTMQAVLSLPTEGEQYILHMGNVSKFKLEIQMKNIATTDDNKAFRTYIILTYDAKKINLFSNNPDRKTSTSSGLIYAVNSPLNARQSDNATFECLLPNDFIENVKESIYINISIEAMSPQRHLRPIVLKIKVKMVANIDLKLLVTPDNYQYREDSLLGFSSITGEEKIGPKMKFSIALENNVQNSVILSSKLLIYFPWEISGNPTETDGQYLLYLLRIPKFSITTGNKKIACNVDILNNITNVIKTRIYQDIIPISKLEDVQLKKVTVPTNVPKLPNISDEIKFLPKDSDSGSISEWENIVLIDCFEGSARCVPVVCDLGPLSRQSGEITLQFDIRIWIHTLIENFLKYKFVYIDIPVFWVPLVDYDVVLQVPGGNYKKVRVVAANLQKPKPPASLDVIYAIIIAVSAGVILLATIVIILYKCNFFRRQNVGKRRWK